MWRTLRAKYLCLATFQSTNRLSFDLIPTVATGCWFLRENWCHGHHLMVIWSYLLPKSLTKELHIWRFFPNLSHSKEAKGVSWSVGHGFLRLKPLHSLSKCLVIYCVNTIIRDSVVETELYFKKQCKFKRLMRLNSKISLYNHTAAAASPEFHFKSLQMAKIHQLEHNWYDNKGRLLLSYKFLLFHALAIRPCDEKRLCFVWR